MIFNERLKLLRKEQGLTQTQVADKLSVTLRNYQRFEADGSTPNYVNLIKIADIFNVSLDYLTGRTDQREVNR
ncbi:MAG: helix-turn-helix transcriptional regulator [Lawsonibacter sp.]|jgi:transcriptional regulator with XRE-family HTH domain|nr:helix-turn-helix transcriptional regulator [Lawsonibacter sp.]